MKSAKPQAVEADWYPKARRHLARRDVVLKRLIKVVGPCTLKPAADLFGALARSIIAQQISTKAAASIAACLVVGPCKGKLTAAALVACADEALRAAGLSDGKRRSLRHLAEMVTSGALKLGLLKRLPDEEVIERLLPVRGIGRWTAQMFLIFSLGRPNVLPVDDFGLRNAVKREYGLAELPDKAEVVEVAAPWQPYCSLATWYLWRSLDPSFAQNNGEPGASAPGG